MNQNHPTSDRDPAVSPTGNSGCVFILSNEIDQQPKIHEEYAQQMRELWEYQFRCHLFWNQTHLNLRSNDIEQAFKELSTTDKAIQFDYLVVVISATGCLRKEENNTGYKSPHIMGSDGKWFSESKMLALFFNDNDKWKGKPKLFILNYCRFAEESDGYDASTIRQQIPKKYHSISPSSRETGRDISQRIPTISDFTIVYGSSPRLLSVMKEVFSDQWKSKSISQMLTKVNEKMRDQQHWSVFESSQESAFMLTEEDVMKSPTFKEFLDEDGRKSYTRDDVLKLHESFQSSRPGVRLSKGCVLLISNGLYPGDTSHEADERSMNRVWAKRRLCDLFDGKSHLNKSAAEMKDLCEQFSTMQSAGYEYAVIIISSHGGLESFQTGSKEGSSDTIQRQCMYGYNEGDFLSEHELLELFNRSESTWRSKVKIFILDCCRGEVKDPGIIKSLGFADPCEQQVNDVRFKYNPNELPPSISTVVDDSIIIYATQSPYVAYSGGLIVTIGNVFDAYYSEESILEMLTRVNASMKQPGREKIAMSLFKSTLTDDYHLCSMPGTY